MSARVPIVLLTTAALGLIGCAQPGITSGELTYPLTATVDQVDVYHGVEVSDPYRWLEDLDGPATREWIEAQNELTYSYLDEIPFRSAIRDRLEELWNYEKFGTPREEGGRYFYSYNDGLQNQSVLYVQEGLEGTPRVLIDPNTFSADGTVSMAGWSPSPDGQFLAYAISEGGSDWREWKVRDVSTGEDLPDHLEWTKFTGATWHPDSNGFYYTGYPIPEDDALGDINENATVYFHELGTEQSADEVIFRREDQPRWGFGAGVTEDGRWLLISGSEGTARKNRLWAKNLVTGGDFLPLYVDFDAQYSVIGNVEDTLFIRTTRDAPRAKVIAVEVDPDGDMSEKTVLAQADDVLQSVGVLGGRLIATYLRNAHSQVKVYDLDGDHQYDLELPTLGSAGGFSGKETKPTGFFRFSSFTYPPTIFKIDYLTGETSVFRRPEVDFDPAAYAVEQVWYESKDGTQVPMFIVRQADAEADFTNPALLYGYGGFNISMTPSFSPGNLAWVEMGGVYAVANLRGGGEFGAEWHQAGTIHNKQNVFDDFIAAAEYLIGEGWTRDDLLTIRGGSNGGLLVGACMTQRPELFAVALPAVGVLDMLRYHLFTIGWAWASDYGTVDDPAQFATLMKYSPVHHVELGRHYPSTMVTTGDHDDRVVPSHSYKFASALQRAQGGESPVLIRIETRGGHGGGKPTSMIIDNLADQWAFAWFEMGRKPQL
ncbi:MAG: S9 family peptidase [Planctomycetes bacterium]|nr:S9 family peptidase [Planctomycetota bacterium]